MTQAIPIAVQSDPVSFSVRTKPISYGDGRTFHEFQIVMRLRGRIVGSEAGPSRVHVISSEARRAGWARVKILSDHRLYAIRVTRKDINNGEGHDCESCAIALALYRNQERMGFPKWSHTFRVAPYAGMGAEAYGIALGTRMCDIDIATGESGMPDLVFPLKRGGVVVESMMEWAMLFDEWEDKRGMGIAEWREEYGKAADETPSKPWPVSFVLNLTEMKESCG